MSQYKTSTYPYGPCQYMEPNEIVQVCEVVAGKKKFVDRYVGELCHGDDYYKPIEIEERPKPTRTGDMILAWMEENGIDSEIVYGVDMEPEDIMLSNKHGAQLVCYPYGEGCLREACEFCMDLEDQENNEISGCEPTDSE